MSLSAEEIKESLSVFDIDVSEDEVLEKLLEIAHLFGYDADAVVNEWLAYQSTKSCSLTITNLENLLLEKTVVKNREKNNKTPGPNRKRKPAVYTAENIDQLFENSTNDDDEDILGAYGTPGVEVKPKKTRIVTPKSAAKIKPAFGSHLGNSPVFSPSTLSPNTTSSQKYGSRNSSGEQLVTFGKSLESVESSRSTKAAIIISRRHNVSRTYKYMFQKIVELSDVMNDMIETLGETIRKQHCDEIEAFAPCSMPSQQDVHIVGRVCCDQGGGVGRLNPQSVILQGDRMSSYGKSVAVDLSQLDQYSLFPGQIVAMSGTNPTGKKFLATKIFSPASESPATPTETSSQKTEPLSLLIATGPFTTSDSLSYEPLIDLISVVKTTLPDVTILVGPLLDSKHDDVKNGQVNIPFDELFQDQINSVVEALKSFTQVVVVSSQREASCHPVYPQPPYIASTQMKNVHFVGDPCVLEIDQIKVAVTSNDILFHLGAEEISKVNGPSDRLGRLSQHLLHQRSFYPLCPSNENLNVDWVAAEDYGAMTHRPDILILPSDLKCFVKEIEGCVCVNPGRLTKGMTGGTYTRLFIDGKENMKDGESLSKFISAQVIKI